MNSKETIKSAWIDDGNHIVSFEQINGARQYSAEEAEFWIQIMTWMREGYAIQ